MCAARVKRATKSGTGPHTTAPARRQIAGFPFPYINIFDQGISQNPIHALTIKRVEQVVQQQEFRFNSEFPHKGNPLSYLLITQVVGLHELPSASLHCTQQSHSIGKLSAYISKKTAFWPFHSLSGPGKKPAFIRSRSSSLLMLVNVLRVGSNCLSSSTDT